MSEQHEKYHEKVKIITIIVVIGIIIAWSIYAYERNFWQPQPEQTKSPVYISDVTFVNGNITFTNTTDYAYGTLKSVVGEGDTITVYLEGQKYSVNRDGIKPMTIGKIITIDKIVTHKNCVVTEVGFYNYTKITGKQAQKIWSNAYEMNLVHGTETQEQYDANGEYFQDIAVLHDGACYDTTSYQIGENK